VQILLQLKSAGIVESTRGAAGGYRLARDPATLSLGEVVAIIEGVEASGSEVVQSGAAKRALHEAWMEAEAARREALAGITFADLLERSRGRSEAMYYI
jgi:Rrf2 family protein